MLQHDITHADLRLYAISLVDLYNVVTFAPEAEEAEAFLDERADIIFVARPGAITEDGRISETVLTLFAGRDADILRAFRGDGDLCKMHRLDYDKEATVFVIHDLQDDSFDPRCFNVAMAGLLGLDLEGIATSDPRTALKALVDAFAERVD